MKFKKSPDKKGNLIVEIEPGNTRLLGGLNGPITALKEILVPIDFSECSKYALRYAVAFAAQFEARITLLSVVQDARTSFELGNPDYIDQLETRKKSYQQELKKLSAKSLGKFPNAVLIRSGRPYEEIVKAASELNTDLIVISTHGQMGLRKVELGSTAERVIRYAPCPVLVIREKERGFAPPV
jgi:nucleotide-binding universal stress UspA family protein